MSNTNAARRAAPKSATQDVEPRRINSNVRAPATLDYIRTHGANPAKIELYAKLANPGDAQAEAAAIADLDEVRKATRNALGLLCDALGGAEAGTFSISRLVTAMVQDAAQVADLYVERKQQQRDAMEAVQNMPEADFRELAGLEGAYERARRSTGFFALRSVRTRVIAEQAAETMYALTGKKWTPPASATSGVRLTQAALAADMAALD